MPTFNWLMQDILEHAEERKRFTDFVKTKRHGDMLEHIAAWVEVKKLLDNDASDRMHRSELEDLLESIAMPNYEALDLSAQADQHAVLNYCVNELQRTVHRQYVRYRR